MSKGLSDRMLRHPDARCTSLVKGAARDAFTRIAAAAKSYRSGTLKSEPGATEPLGASDAGRRGVNFALHAPAATSVLLCLFSSNGEPLTELPMIKKSDVWTAIVAGLPKKDVLYAYRVDGAGGWETGYRWTPERLLLDPYAKHVSSRKQWATRDDREQYETDLGSVFLGTFDFTRRDYDWGRNYSRPDVSGRELIIYEVPLRLFTAHPNSGVGADRQGTFLGFRDKIPHLVEMGVTAVEILPVFEYDELEFQRSVNPRDHMVNVWGYSHINFFAPMARFAAGGGGPFAAALEFKQLVAALHAAGIQVILDVVYNHTNEGGDDDPYVTSFRGIDNPTYYMTDTDQYVQLLNYSGCGNTTNANHPVMQQLIMDSLRQWVEEYHVDGFRFDLASVMCRDGLGNPIDSPPIVRAIAMDPVLSQVHLLAEPWDCGMYQVGSFPNWDIWGEWNGKFRDDMRKFVKGDAGMKKAVATRIAGSADLYHNHNRRPDQCINFIVAHDGFTLHDLVSYNDKHNDANGESNRDGTNDNFSWNCGAEGATDNQGVLAMRKRQMRNFMVVLMVSQGTPMIVAGDEYGATRGGNNNWYGHDNELTWFDWEALESERNDFFRFYSHMLKWRRECPLLGRSTFMEEGDVTWHESHWDDDESRFLAFTLHDRGQGGGDVYVALNSHKFEVQAGLPSPPFDCKWSRLVDTNLEAPKDFTPGGNSGITSFNYGVQAYSSVILIAKPE